MHEIKSYSKCLNVGDPIFVRLYVVTRQTKELHTSLLELMSVFSHRTKLGCAYGCEIPFESIGQ